MLGSDVTKISEPVSMFDGLKIPRAHAVDASGSEVRNYAFILIEN